ncbi:MAG: hypothetical protein PHF00_06595 [Elusimicrobia bacterium]|nr:hypothetical protein [Elusimicrobiota bacterium]
MRKRNTKYFAALAAAAIWLGAAAPRAWARKPRNPRWGKPARASERAAAPSGAAKAKTAPAPDLARLAAGRWQPEVKDAIERLAARLGRSDARYDSQRPPIAVVAFNDAALVNDVGFAVFQRMVEKADFKFDDPFWREVPLVFGRQRLRAAWEMFAGLPVSIWRRQPAYFRYRKGFLAAYRDMCARLGRRECRVWLVKLLRGYTEEELSAYALAALSEEYSRAPAEERIEEEAGDPNPVIVRRGVARVPEMVELCRFLRREGFELWILDPTAQAELEIAAREFGIDAARVRGIRSKYSGDKATGEILPPVPYRGGKAELVSAQIGRPPDLVVGAGLDDQDLLALPGGLRVLLDRGDESLRGLASEQGWLLQPAFAP